MNHTITSEQQHALARVLAQYPLVPGIVQAIANHKGQALLVGGAVRDLLLGLPIKDLDIEVHGIPLPDLEKLLASFGPVSLVGKSFGVLRVHGLDVDWSVPRSDSAGRKPAVTIDPHMPLADAFRRRDLTINAMAIDVTTYALIDPFNGQHDLAHGILRAPNAHLFAEDPLRFFRVMQFIARFGMTPDATLQDVCSRMDVTSVSRERIEGEFEKMLLKSGSPSLGIRWLRTIGRLKEIMPEVAALIDVPQEYAWHPEGDVFEHTMQALDAAAALPYSGSEKLVLMYAALCHDLGKAVTTQKIDGKWKSHGHDQAGVPLTKKLLRRITHNTQLISMVCTLVKHHMAPGIFVKAGAKPAAYKRLAAQLAPDVSMQMLADLAIADKSGRNGSGHTPLTDPLPDIQEFIERAEQARVRSAAQPPVLLGRDLLDVVNAGPELGVLLKRAYAIQLEHDIQDKETLRQRVLKEQAPTEAGRCSIEDNER